MRESERHRLLFGPYKAPALRVGERAFCLARDCDVIVTSWTDARISWPRCQPLHTRGGSGILVDETLAFVIRNESALAIRYWWGVNVKTMAWWRRLLGVGRADPEGSRRLIEAASLAGVRELKLHGLTDEQCDRRCEQARRDNRIRFVWKNPPIPLWTEAELRVLEQEFDDAEAAKAIGRTETAVRVMRWRLETGRRRKGKG